jgi:hypothetical protein
MLRHVDDRQSKFGRHRNFVSLGGGIVKGGVKRLACERGHELGGMKARGLNRRFARGQDATSDAATCPFRMDEESSYARRIAWGLSMACSLDRPLSPPKSELRLLQPPQRRLLLRIL